MLQELNRANKVALVIALVVIVALLVSHSLYFENQSGLFVILFLPLIFFFFRLHVQSFRDLATRLGLEYSWNKGALEGNCRGHQVCLMQVSPEDSTAYWTVLVKFPQPLVLGLELTKKGTFDHIYHAIAGGGSLETGDREFDDQMRILGDNRDGVVAFLTPARRLLIQRLFSSYGGCKIDDQSIYCETDGLLDKDPARLLAVLEEITDIARQLSENPPEDGSLDIRS